jgi:uncharacterized protein (TIGR02271 family)
MDTDRSDCAHAPSIDDEVVMPLLGEEIAVAKSVAQTRRVMVQRLTREQRGSIAAPLAEERVEITRVPIGREVDAMPPIREEGDTVIIPILEEQLVFERRLFLKEEVRVRHVRGTRMHRENVTLRHHDIEVSAVPLQQAREPGPVDRFPPEGEIVSTNVRNRRDEMKYQTIAAAFDTRAHAKAAVDALKAAGFHPDDISLLDKKVVPEADGWIGKGPSLWQRIFGTEVMQHEAAVYTQAVEFGGAVVSVRVPEYEVAHATGILDLHHPIDVKDRALTADLVPAAKVEAAVASIPVVPLPVKQEIAVPLKLAERKEQFLSLADEQLKVGKRMIETGKTRVRRFVTERDVSADVTLHEEHAEVLRRAVTDPKFLANVDWSDKEIEVIETAEQALVNKTAKVVEEIALKKIGSDHVQTLHEKVRRQEAAIEHLGPDGKLIIEKVNAPELVGASIK